MINWRRKIKQSVLMGRVRAFIKRRRGGIRRGKCRVVLPGIGQKLLVMGGLR